MNQHNNSSGNVASCNSQLSPDDQQKMDQLKALIPMMSPENQAEIALLVPRLQAVLHEADIGCACIALAIVSAPYARKV